MHAVNFWTGSHLLAQGAQFVNATQQTIIAGGDNGSRNMFVNAVNAAIEGLGAIPTDWVDKTVLYPQYLEWATQLVAHRTKYF